MSNRSSVPEVLVILPRPLLALFPDAVAKVIVPAKTVADMIAALDARWPGMRARLKIFSRALTTGLKNFFRACAGVFGKHKEQSSVSDNREVS